MNSTFAAWLEGSTTTLDTIIGFIAMLISCVAFGTMFIPLKKTNCGNVLSVPIIGGLGMGMGILIWGTMQTFVGWSVAKFGLMGWLEPTDVAYPLGNNVGLGLTIISGGLFFFVRTKTTSTTDVKQATQEESVEGVEGSRRREMVRKAPFFAMAVGLAVLHGLMMAPVDIMKKLSASADPYKVFDFCFAFYSSAFFFSSLYFIAYCVICRQKALVNRSLVIPSVFNGLLWTLGMSCWMLAGDKLSQVVAFPVATRLPAIIAALCDVFIYKVIEGRRNLCVLAVSVPLGIFGVVAIALSNQSFS